MGALLVAIACTVIGALAGGLLAFRGASTLSGSRRSALARGAVTLLGGAAGAQIAAQLFNLVHQLQRDRQPPFNVVHGRGDALAVIDAAHGILFYGGLLIALAAVVGLVAAKQLGDERSV